MTEQNDRKIPFYKRRPIAFSFFIMFVLFFAYLIMLIAINYIGRQPAQGVKKVSLAFGKKVAIVKVEGVILDSEKVIREFEKYRKDSSVRAIILRVNSPGGAVAPSQEIYREIEQVKREKPVVASMATIAASGGYYICAPCSYIFANPGTVTGSIGVLMEFTNLEELLGWMKIKNQVLKTGKYKDTGSPYRELTEEELKYLQGVIDRVLAQFKDAIIKGRNLTESEILPILDGRIFTGEEALSLKLVDELGNLNDAIRKAADLGGIVGEPEVVWPMRGFDFWGNMVQGLIRVFEQELRGNKGAGMSLFYMGSKYSAFERSK